MASIPSSLARPTLQFLKVRSFRPLSTRPVTSKARLPRAPPAKRASHQPPAQTSGQPQSQPQSQSIQDATSPSPTVQPAPSISTVLANTDPAQNSLLAPVHIPEDPQSIIKSTHPSTSLLTQSGLVVQRQIEMMNIFLGFEQANRYIILNPQGEHIGYMAEHDGGIAKTMGRQWFRTHRAFTTHVFSKSGQEVLRFHRPFSWINTRIKIFDPVELNANLQTSNATDLQISNDGIPQQHISNLKTEEMRVIGEVQSEWAPLRRKYDLFLARAGADSNDGFQQFARIDEKFLSWDFSLKDENGKLIGSVNRNWVGLAKEMFADVGMYALRMDAAGLEEEAANRHIVSQSHQDEKAYGQVLGTSNGMTLDQRAIMLATAVNIDFDYFSRKSHGGGIIPLPMMMGGGASAEGAAAGAGAAEIGTAGAIGETVSTSGAVGAAGRAATSVGAGEGAIAGAGTMAGYEAMQRGMGRGDDASPQAPTESAPPPPPQPNADGQPPNASSADGQNQDVWGSGDSDPWSEKSIGAGEESGGIGSSLWDAFFGDGE